MDTAFVARQPIFNRDQKVFAYELLFRSDNDNAARFEDGDQATASVVLNALTDIGIERVAGNKPAFINVTRNLILGDDLMCLPHDRIVLEILEDIRPDPEVLQAVRKLAEAGYTIALDDVVYCEGLRPLVELADIVKVDLPLTPRDQLADHVRELKQYPARLLAEKVETQEEFELCRNLGFDLFQGYFFCRPQVLSERKIQGNCATIMRLLAELQDPKISPDKVEQILQADPNVTYKVLRFVNSASSSAVKRIESIRHAAAMMGIQRIRAFASLMLLASVNDSKPRELLAVALTRAKMCELLAEKVGERRKDRPFTVGLLSVLDALLDMPMQQVIESLPLTNEMNDALLHRDGLLGDLLNMVLQYESGEPPHANSQSEVQLASSDLADAYYEAVQWATECADRAV